MKYFIFFLLAFQAHAGSLNLIGHRFTDSYRYSILDDSLQDRHAKNYILSGSYGYVKSPFYFTDQDDNRQNDIISYNHALTYGLSRYFGTDWLVGFQGAMVNNKVLDKTYSTPGDTQIKAVWNFFRRSFNASLNGKLWLPTGRGKNYSGAMGPGASLSLVSEKKLNRWNFLLSGGYQYFDNQVISAIDYGEIFLTQLGISYDLTEMWVINFETYRNFSFNTSDSTDEGDYFITAKFNNNHQLSSYAGVGVAGLDSPSRNNFTSFVGLKYSFDSEKPSTVQFILPSTFSFENRDSEKILGTLLKSENVYFENNSTEISPKEMLKINNVVKLYAENKLRLSHIVIEGYASKRGRFDHNQKLSQSRAIEVKKKLMELGLPESSLSIVGYGDQLEQSSDERDNRRVQFRAYLTEGKL
jgi:outer membrane protein OmpA-like peptidoglycan-associated protein